MNKNSHTAKAVLFRWNNGEPEILLLEHKVRENTAPQKRGGKFKEWPRWGLPGGKVEEGETLIEAVIRETEEETGMKLLKGMFNDEHAVHCDPKPSKREGYDEHQDHYYFAFLLPHMTVGEMESDNEEIVRGRFFPLDKIPTPDDKLPFTRNQLRGLVKLLRHLEDKVWNADRWLAIVEKRMYSYLS